MGRITSYSKQIVVFFLVLSLFIRPTFAASVGGWSMGNPIAQGASTIYEGSKNVIINGADYVKKGTAIIRPTATGVGKTLAKGVAGAALSVAVEQLLGAVDWVLDPANNQIVYREPQATVLNWSRKAGSLAPLTFPATVKNVCSYVVNLNNNNGSGYTYKLLSSSTSSNSKTVYCTIEIVGVNTGHLRYETTGTTETVEKKIPLDVVAAQVISNADSNTDRKVAAQAATTAAAADIVAEAETDNVKARPISQQLEASSSTKPADQAVADKAAEAQGTAKPNEANPEATDLSLEFPAFCGWAPTVCEFAQTAIQSIADVKAEYADKPQENTDTELQIPDLEQDIEVDSDISFGGSCPAPLTSQVNFMGINETIEFSFENVCEIAEFIKPVVISVSAFSAALIVAGIRTEDD